MVCLSANWLYDKEITKPHRYRNKIEKSKLKIEETLHAATDKASFERKGRKTRSRNRHIK